MKKTMKNVFAFALVLSLALGISSIPASAASVKGIVAPLTVTVNEDGGPMGTTLVSSWMDQKGNFSPEFTSYKISADVYLPRSIFNNDGGKVFIDPMVSFWFPDLGTNGILEDNEPIIIDFDRGNNFPVWDNGFVKEASLVGDMIKVEIVDATVNATLKTMEWDEASGSRVVWTDPIPEAGAGDACPLIWIATDRAFKGKFAVANASIKIGDTEYKTNYSKKDTIGNYDGETEGYNEVKAVSFNTSYLSVAKTSVKIKKKKSTTVKVTTMFSGDKVKVSSSSSKVAKATYKSGKVTVKGLKKGKATVSVKANGKTKKIKVTVK